MTRIRMGLVAGLVLAVGVAVGACTGGGGTPGGVASLGGADQATPTTTAAGGSSDPTQAALNYGRCMRQHGINMPDPPVRGDDIDLDLPRGVNRDDPKYQAAWQACKGYLPDGGPTEDPQTPQELQQMLAFARCLRQHGINVPDPKPGGGIEPGGTNTNDPRFTAAQRACQPLLPNGGGKRTQRNGGGG